MTGAPALGLARLAQPVGETLVNGSLAHGALGHA